MYIVTYVPSIIGIKKPFNQISCLITDQLIARVNIITRLDKL